MEKVKVVWGKSKFSFDQNEKLSLEIVKRPNDQSDGKKKNEGCLTVYSVDGDGIIFSFSNYYLCVGKINT